MAFTSGELKELEAQGITKTEAESIKFYNLEEAGEKLGLTVDKLEELIGSGNFKAITINNEYFTTGFYIDRYLKNMEEETGEEAEEE